MIEQLKNLFISLFLRNPSEKFRILALSGKAVMVWTPEGNIVVTTETARQLATRLDQFADISEDYHDRINN